MDAPPILRPEETPSPAELARLARELLHEMANDRQDFADWVQARGLDLAN